MINPDKIAKTLFETSPDMIAILDPDGKIIDCNLHLENNTNYNKKELIGLMGPIDLIIDEDKKIATSAFKELKITNMKQNIPLRIKRKDGYVFSSIWSGSTLRNNSNELEGYLVTGKNISDTDNLELKLISVTEQHRQEKLAIIGEFSARIAHDIRNPLAIAMISLENLKMLYGADGKKQKQLDRVERSIHRITHQIEDVLNFVREKPINLKEILFSQLISESIDSITILEGIKIITPKNDVKIICDKKQLLIVLNNLILNAIQAINDVGIIEITIDEIDNKLIIQIKDSGEGISNENMKKIFQPLFTTKQHGTGLGLVSVKSIIESHGGTISVTSPPTIFTITLPKTNS